MLNLKDLPVASFPDGHKHLILPEDHEAFGSTSIRASLRNFDDVFLLYQAKQIIPTLRHLYITYLLGARCDRQFSRGEALDLDIVAFAINNIGFETVRVLKPHSPVAGTMIDNMEEADISLALIALCGATEELTSFGLVSPDKGALPWVTQAFKSLENATELIVCSKERDMDAEHRGVGRIVVPDLPEDIEDYVILDDLCDGGGTFLGIASQMREKGAKRIFLAVTHAILSKGPEVFDGIIDGVYCTNSFADFDHSNIHQINVQ